MIILEIVMYDYKATVVNIVDADTIDVDIDLGFGILLKNQRIRISGIDAPEMRTLDRVEKLFGNLATQRAKEFLETKNVILQCETDSDGKISSGKFGRILGDVYIDEKSLAQTLLDEGHAVKYDIDEKETETQTQINRERLLLEGKVTQEEIDEAEEETKKLIR